ncbi:unnamed protein product [Hymenolepis diminuta]|uniref:Saposin B-type domain-containing protein n=1 Tax=Hymenolepis diminuta TaxID=6216 RepID=A0A0R3SJ14_HYMDI|nr:unnamed protein product [Hymenolepis diminuta]VUZ47833.1 unnamed protein product [Hymenolepis diminuta]
MAKQLILYLSVGVFVFLLINLTTVSGQGTTRSQRFQACVKKCSEMGGVCNDQVKDLWMEFLKNKKEITRHLRKCCLRNEKRQDVSPDDSFATCVRINCGAALWGCQMIKKHSGFLSQDEKEHLKEGAHD